MSEDSPLGLTAEQQAVRSRGIGASEIAAVCGLDPRRTPLEVYLEKVGELPPRPKSEAQHFGHRLETAILAEYADRRRLPIQIPDPAEATRAHPDERWVLCTPDAFVLEPETARTIGGVDAKNRFYFAREQWGVSGTDEVPLAVAAQMQWSMIVVAVPWWDVALLLGGNEFRIFRVHQDDEVQTMLMERGRDFWFQHVQAHAPPPLDGSQAAHDWLARRFPQHLEILTPATPELEDVVAKLRRGKEAVKVAEAEIAALEAQVKEAIADAAGIEGSFGKVTWKLTKSGGVDHKGQAEALAMALADLRTQVALAQQALALPDPSLATIRTVLTTALTGAETALSQSYDRPGYRRMHYGFKKETR